MTDQPYQLEDQVNPLAGTYGYTGSATVSSSGGANIIPITISPCPGFKPTSWTVTMSPASTNLTSMSLLTVGGSSPGSAVLTGNISAGNSTVSSTGSLTAPSDTTGYNVRAGVVGPISAPITYTFTVTITWSDAPNPPACAYGAEVNPSAEIYTYITAALVDAVAIALGMGPLGIVALDTLIGAPILFPTCSNVPTIPDALVDSDFIDGTGLPNPLHLDHWFSNFTYGVWLFYCRCKAAPSGLPAPTNPTIPVLPPRLRPGPQPVPPCSNTDVCTTLIRIEHILTNVNLQIQNNSYMQQEPAYTYGTPYPGLSGNGEIAVSGILGVFVSFTTLPNRVGRVTGDPDAIWDVGYITFGSTDAWYTPQRITTNPWLTLPLHMANISRVGYSIPFDCTATIQLLVAVPMSLSAAAGT